MARPTIARSLRFTLLGLTLALAAIAGLGVASLLHARERYENRLAAAYRVEVDGARLLAAAVAEEGALRAGGGAAARAEQRRAAGTFDSVAATTLDAARPDAPSARLLEARIAAQRSARRLRDAGARRAALLRGRVLDGRLAMRQETRRRAANDQARHETRSAVVRVLAAGGLAILAALALIGALIGSMRRPLDELVEATGGLASGNLQRRVEPHGPRELDALARSFNLMAGDLESARSHIEDERRRLEVTIESLGDALVVTDGAGVVTALNPRAADLVPELAVGSVAREATGPLPLLSEALDGEAVVQNGPSTLAVTAARLGGEDDGIVWTIRDTSERAKLERLKSEFVATASHELRSPLTSIKGFAELLAATEGLDERQREFARVILLSANRLVELVNDLLDLTRAEAGGTVVELQPVDVAEAAREVTTLLGPRFEDKRQILEVDVEAQLPYARADAARVRQILTNLLTNAHLYTEEEGRVGLALGHEDGMVRIEVSDDGRGMAPEDVEHAFDRFYRGARGDRTETGTGLGLAIVSSLVEMHDGTVDVESELGSGTTFTVRLPAVGPASVDGDRLRALRGKRVLIVNDEPEVARKIAERIAPWEVDAVTVTTGAEGIECLRTDRFDAVTIDVLMPGQSGFEVLRALRADEKLRHTPVVVVSAYSGEEALTGEWVVPKPIDAAELTYALGSAVLAGRTSVLVVGREELRERVAPELERLGIVYDWATTGIAAARLCEGRRFEAALVDAGMRNPQAALRALDLRGRRLRRAVVVFSADEEVPGVAKLDAHPLRLEDAAAGVLEALDHGVDEYA